MRVVREIGEALRSKQTYHGVVIRSTAIPGTTDLAADVIAQASGKTPGVDFGVATNPEFMREGTSIERFRQSPLSPWSVRAIRDWPRCSPRCTVTWVGTFHLVGPREAELLKYACNAFHAVKVTFAERDRRDRQAARASTATR